MRQTNEAGLFKFDIACAVRSLVRASKSIGFADTIATVHKREISFNNIHIGNKKPKSRKNFSRLFVEVPVEIDKEYIRKTKAAYCIQRLFFAEKARRFASCHLLFKSGFMNTFTVMMKMKKMVRLFLNRMSVLFL
jgi:hypothetical protein